MCFVITIAKWLAGKTRPQNVSWGTFYSLTHLLSARDWLMVKVGSHQHKAGINKTERARSTNASTTVYHRRPMNWCIKSSWTTHGPQEVEESTWRCWNTKVWPCRVVKLNHLPCFRALHTHTYIYTHWFNGHPSRWTWVSWFSLDSPSPYILFNAVRTCGAEIK